MEDKRRGKRRTIALVFALAVLAWAWLCPSYIGRWAAKRAILSALDDPAHGLACKSVDVDFTYLGLVRDRSVRRLRIRGIRADLSSNLTGQAAALFTNRTVTADVDVGPNLCFGGMIADIRGRALDWPFAATAAVRIDWSWTRPLSGRARFALAEHPDTDTPWAVDAEFEASPSAWHAEASVAAFTFDETDDVLGTLLGRAVPPDIGNLRLRGQAALKVSAEKTPARPVACWTADLPLVGIAASANVGGKDYAVDGLRLHARASGIADHTDIAPLYLHADSVSAAGIGLTNLAVSARADASGRSVLVTEAGVGVCGGEVKLYALKLDPRNLNADFTLFADDIDTERVMNAIPGFRGEASGRLHGKLPLTVRKGSSIRLHDAFLYSTPGETGKLRVEDASAVTANLAAGGVGEAACENLAKALADLDYTALKLKLVRDDSGAAALSVKIEGSATSGKTTVPVSFEVTFHGDLEQIINLGLRTATKGKTAK